MTTGSPAIVAASSARIASCALCLGAIVFCALWADAARLEVQGRRGSPVDVAAAASPGRALPRILAPVRRESIPRCLPCFASRAT